MPRRLPKRRTAKNNDKTTAVARRDQKGLATRRDATALKRKAENADLNLLLRGHALQTSTIIDRAAQAEAGLLSFATSGKTKEAALIMRMARQLDLIRSNALRDMERLSKTVVELENPAPRITVYANMPQERKARVVDLDSRRRLESK
jgi:dihydroxyacid dehydratase/phosphogluconate dehydratase